MARIICKKRAWKRPNERERDRKSASETERARARQNERERQNEAVGLADKGRVFGKRAADWGLRASLYESRLCVWETSCSEYSGPWTPGKGAGPGRGFWAVRVIAGVRGGASSHWVASAQARWHHENITAKKDQEQSAFSSLPHRFRPIWIEIIMIYIYYCMIYINIIYVIYA